MQHTLSLFDNISIDPSWAFADKTRRDTAYITHGYHRYPAKFIPQIVSRLAEKYTQKGDLIVDPFGGCGTTLVESKVMSRPSIGVDINPVAVLVTKVKKTPIAPHILEEQFTNIKHQCELFSENTIVDTPQHSRIDYWFMPEEKKRLSFLFAEIKKIENKDIKDFFYCGFSNILKSCSIWLQSSNKPTRDLEKTPAEPFATFARQIKAMLRGNATFYQLLQTNNCLETACEVFCTDARTLPVESNSVSLIVTSPPYVTSYEYADLHQLSALWFEYTHDITDFRKRFIGTSHRSKTDLSLNSKIAQKITTDLFAINKKTSEEVATYFGEMNQVFGEMKRALKKGGRACIVIGNTNLKGVDITNAEVFVEQLHNQGFTTSDIIKREIPSKMLPSTRDKTTGRFTKTSDMNKVLVYPTEYILIMQKK